MPITVISGRPGAGKSLKTAQELIRVLERNRKWHKKTGIVRRVYSNLRVNDKLEKKYEQFLKYWKDPEELVLMKDCDVFMDEIANYFDANGWKELSLSLKRWLAQHRKLGIEIYGNAQDFSQVDIAFRRMTSDLFYLVKLISSFDVSPTRPKVKHVWGFSIIYKMNPVDYKEDQKENKTSFSGVLWINKEKTQVFDTRQEIKPGEYPKYRHLKRYCEDPLCDFSRVLHN